MTRKLSDRILKFNILNVHKMSGLVFFSIALQSYVPFFDFCIVNLWNRIK